MTKKESKKDLSKEIRIKSTAEVEVPEKIIDQIIGQEKGVEIIKKAAEQKRHVLLIGVPGSGKSMLAQGMAELLPVTELEDILIVENKVNENEPKVKTVLAGEGRKLIEQERMKNTVGGGNISLLMIVFMFLSFFLLLFYGRSHFGDVITAAMFIGLFIAGGAMIFASQIGRARMMIAGGEGMKLIVDNSGRKKAPFVDATGSKAGALLGDCRHDPLQSGGLGTPAHLRVEAGAIHRAHRGVLFVDEFSSLTPKSQQELLTAMQEKKYSITGQSEMSSGALVRTEPVPCDFCLVAAGNYHDVRRMHPALRSRIRGYGYEIYMEDVMDDTPENRQKLIRFVAQEVKKDGKIPHFSGEAVEEIIKEARKRAGRKNKLTLRLRDLGGLIRAAGDVAKEEGAELVNKNHVEKAKKIARTLEQQVAQQAIDLRKEYQVFATKGSAVGKVNGLAVMGESGIILPIVAEVAPSSSREEGRIIATGKLGEIAKEAVENVSATIKKHIGKDMRNYDIHVQFLQTYEGVEGDSASISVATAVISALEDVEIDQTIAMTGSLSVRGEVLPVGGVNQKIEAAADSGISKVIIPKANENDLALSEETMKKVKVIPVKDIYEVLKESLSGKRKKELLDKIKKELDNHNGH